MAMSRLVLVVLLSIVPCFTQNLFDPHVFNYKFYLNTNPDLLTHSIITQQEAQEHWTDHGIAEGRQACGSFHVLQYLDRYEDLKKAFGTNYLGAIDHYLTTGIHEGRLGYVEGGAYGRYTVSNSTAGIFLSASTRMGGGIDSVVWNDYEFINCWDHGRELQLAFTNGHGECFNPTECGSSDDDQKTTTNSYINNIVAQQNTLSSTNAPAFWLAPGEREPNPDPTCSVALNTVLTSNYTMSKQVTIGYKGVYNAILFSWNVYNVDNNAIVQIEGPTGYMPIDFSNFYTIDLVNGQVTAVSTTNGEIPTPLIFSTPDGQYAMGSFVKDAPPNTTISYAKFMFRISPDSNATSKWSNVLRMKNISAGQHITASSIICVGTLSQVAQCMVLSSH